MILTVIATGFSLDAPAAASYARMSAQYGGPLPITTAYRTSAQQRYLYLGWIGRKPGFNFALPPGYSKHEVGLAVDYPRAEATWLDANGAGHGWRRTNPAEWWHFEYESARDTHLGENPAPLRPARAPTAVPLPVPVPVPPEDIMATRAELQADLAAALSPLSPTVFRIRGTRGVFLDLGAGRRYLTPEQYAAHRSPAVTDLAASDPFWQLPNLTRVGELVRQAGTAAAWLLADGSRSWITTDVYAQMGRPVITDVPAADPFWLIPVFGPTP